MGGAQFSLDKATAPAGAEKEAVEAGREEGDTGTIEETNQAQAECEFDELKLDEANEKAIENLREEEEVVVLMPAKEFVIAHGPKRTVLYWLCGDVERTEKINDFLEGDRGFIEDHLHSSSYHHYPLVPTSHGICRC